MNNQHIDKLLYETQSWNEWRSSNQEVRPDLRDAILNPRASRASLERSRSIFKHFQRRSFRGIDLSNSDLRAGKVWISDLGGASFRGADLRKAEFRHCELVGADLRQADLRKAQFLNSDLSGAVLEGALLGGTHFGYAKLVNVQGLDQVVHKSGSNCDQLTLINSSPLPVSFLNACGVQSHTIKLVELYAAVRPFYRCFLSYSRRDEIFVGYLREALTWFGVPTWFAPQDMRRREFQADNRELERDLHAYIDEAERLLLIISPNILPSSWVGKEFQRARGFAKVIPIVISDMPSFESPDWNAGLKRVSRRGKQSLLDPALYSKELGELLSRGVIDFRQWRDPSGFAVCFFDLLSRLARVPDNEQRPSAPFTE